MEDSLTVVQERNWFHRKKSDVPSERSAECAFNSSKQNFPRGIKYFEVTDMQGANLT